MMKLSSMAALLLSILLVTPAFADSVLLITNGANNLNEGETPLGLGDTASQSFTLDGDTSITNVDPQIIPQFGGGSFAGKTFEESIEEGPGDIVWTTGPTSDPTNAVTPFVLQAGTYSILVENLTCSSPCIPNLPIALGYYSYPADDTEIGGSIDPNTGFSGGGWNWEIAGTVVPEPEALVLVGTGMLGLAVIALRRKSYLRG
jgi:hypothetical protein